MHSLDLEQQAKDYFNQGNYQTAISLYEQCLEINPEELTYYWWLGLAYFLEGDAEQAQSIWLSVLLQDDLEDSEALSGNLLKFLEKIAIEKNQNKDWQPAYKIYSVIQEIFPDYQNELLETSLKNEFDQIFKEAKFLFESNQNQESIQKHIQLLELTPDRADIWYSLAIVYYYIKDYPNAYEAIIQAINIDNSLEKYYYMLGLIAEKIAPKEEAIQYYEKAIEINPQLIDAYNNLGNLLKDLGQLDKAESIYKQAIECDSKHYGSYINLGNILLEKNRIDAAIQVYQQALYLPESSLDYNIFYNLGLAHERKEDKVKSNLYYGYFAYRSNEYAQAIGNWEEYLSTTKGDTNLYLDLASCYLNLKDNQKAIETYKTAITYYPDEVISYVYLISEYQKLGEIETAVNLADEAIKKFPNNLRLKRLNQSLLPVVYRDEAEIEHWRNRFSEKLDQLSLEIRDVLKTTPENTFSLLNFPTNYFLYFQGKNDRLLQQKYGDLVIDIMHHNYPQWSQPLSLPSLTSTGKIRIGYISARMGLLGFLFLGYLKNHNRQQFEIYCYDLGTTKILTQKDMAIYDQFKLYSDAYNLLTSSLESIVQQIRQDNLHILVYLDIVTEPTTIKLAALKLAPIQCVSWGHPVTSGLKTIDYYLSSDVMESPEACQHYSETLVRLPNLGICLTKPSLPSELKSRSDFQINPDATVYLSCQMLPKYLPQYDYIFVEIAKQIPTAQFLFFPDFNFDKFQERLAKEFAKANLQLEDFCRILPRLNVQDYLNIHLLSDVFLDTFKWSGGVTSLDAIACSLPIVTCPEELMRGRQSYGMLNLIGVTETIANTEQDYIDIAVKLGLDTNWRQSIREKIKANNHRLYEDKTCVEALEQFYLEAVQNYDLCD